MSSLLRKAARVNLVAMDFMLQVTVEELVLETLDTARTLSFELSRGAKVCRQDTVWFLLSCARPDSILILTCFSRVLGSVRYRHRVWK